MLKILTFLSLLSAVHICSQLKLGVKIADDEPNESMIPETFKMYTSGTAPKGYILEFIFTNTSSQAVSFPLDTRSYAIPFAEDTSVYYQEDNISSAPDRLYRLGVYGFINQNGYVPEGDIGCSMPDVTEHQESKKDREEREMMISTWKKETDFENEKQLVSNWYIMKNMRTLKPKESIHYKMYFNPFFKKLCHYCYHEFYDGLKPGLPYDVNFKVVLNEDVYQLMTTEQQKQYKNLYTKTVISNTLRFGGL